MSELARVVAFVFRLQGAASMGRNEFKQLLSFRLNWYPPPQASQLLERALQAGLLEAHGEQVRPGFDPGAVEVPVHFRGSALALEEPLAPRAAGGAPALPAQAPLPDANPERVRALREMARGRLGEAAATLLAAAERGQDVRAAAAERLAAMAHRKPGA